MTELGRTIEECGGGRLEIIFYRKGDRYYVGGTFTDYRGRAQLQRLRQTSRDNIRQYLDSGIDTLS